MFMMSITKQNKFNLRNFLFFSSTTLGAVIGVPLYVYRYGVSTFELLHVLFWVLATGMAITIGYHRLFAHRTFKAHPVVVFWNLFFGAAAFQESALEWASQHRDH